MTHVRQQIRNATTAALTGLTTTGANVFETKLQPIEEQQLPALIISTDEEDVEPGATGGSTRTTQRFITLTVEGRAQESDDSLDDLLDKIAAEVEIAMAADPTLGGTAKDARYDGATWDYDQGANKPIGRILMRFRAVYIVADTDPETPA